MLAFVAPACLTTFASASQATKYAVASTSGANVVAPVEVAFDPADSFFPPTEARALERAGARVTLSPALGHVTPRLGLGLARLVGFVDRMFGVIPQPKFQGCC